MGTSEQIRKRPPTAVEDAEAWLAWLPSCATAPPQAPVALIGRLIAQVRDLERERQKLGNRVTELEAGRGM